MKTMRQEKDMRWKTLASEYVIRRPWLTARKDKVELPTGAVIDEYYVLEYPEWVNIIAITPEGKYVFVRQFRYALGKTVEEICAGVCEEGESPEEAAKRELMEETGFGGGQWEESLVISANASTMTNLTHCFIARNVEPTGERHLDSGEDIEVILLSSQEVEDRLRKGLIWQSLMAAPLWKLMAEEGL